MKRRGWASGACMGALAVLGCDFDNPGQIRYVAGPPPALDAGADAPDPAPSPGPQTVSFPSGRWGLFGFEDPVGIELLGSQSIGCYAGLPYAYDRDNLAECTPLEDLELDGQHLRFSFMAETYRYAADVTVATDASRMAGRFHGTGGWIGNATAWLRIDNGDVWLKYHGDPSMSEALKARASGFALRLEEGRVPGVFEPDVDYNLRLSVQGYGPYVAGDLGAFWGDELRWSEDDGILSAGPVAATDPFMAVSLTLDFSRGDTVWVVATWPSGTSSTFAAQRR